MNDALKFTLDARDAELKRITAEAQRPPARDEMGFTYQSRNLFNASLAKWWLARGYPSAGLQIQQYLHATSAIAWC